MKRFNKNLITLCLFIWSLVAFVNAGLAQTSSPNITPNVLVTIKPIHSLVAGVMKGVAEPGLLMKSNQSLHHYNLRPSERRLIAQASLLFWVGPELEVFLPRLLSDNTIDAKSVSLIKTKTLLKLKVQNEHEHHEHVIDPHIWLSSRNAIALVDEIAYQLSSIDPAHKKQYTQNKNQLKKKIERLSEQFSNKLGNNKKAYITYHNSIQYLENELKLNNIASIQTNSETQPSAQHISSIVKNIKQNKIRCLVYNEPEKPRLITSLQSQTQTTSVAIDPTGVTIESGENAWFEIMENVTSNLSSCLNKQ